MGELWALWATIVGTVTVYVVYLALWLDGEMPWQTHMPRRGDFIMFAHRHITCRLKGHDYDYPKRGWCWRCDHQEAPDGK